MESSLPRLEAYLRQEAPFNVSDIANELVTSEATSNFIAKLE